MMLTNPSGIEPQFFCQNRLLTDFTYELPRCPRIVRIGVVTESEVAKLHSGLDAKIDLKVQQSVNIRRLQLLAV